MSFSSFIKKIGIFILILLAGYGALVTYFDVAEGKERSKVVLNLEDLNLDLDSPVGAKLEDSLNLEKSQDSTDASQTKPSDKVASQKESSDLVASGPDSEAAKSATASKKKAAFTGDLGKLDLSKEGMEEALPKSIESSNSKNFEKEKEAEKKELDSQTKQKIEEYLVASSKIEFPKNEVLALQALSQVVEEGKTTKLNQNIDQFQQAYENLKSITPPAPLKNFHENSLRTFELSIELLKKLKRTKNLASTLESETAKELSSVTSLANTQLQSIKSKYNLDLPEGVFSDPLSKSPTDTDETSNSSVEQDSSTTPLAASASTPPAGISESSWESQEAEVEKMQENDSSVGMQCGDGTALRNGIGPTMQAECCEGCCQWCGDECCVESCEMKCEPYAYLWDSVSGICGCGGPVSGPQPK